MHECHRIKTKISFFFTSEKPWGKLNVRCKIEEVYAMPPVFYEDNPNKEADSFFSGPLCDHPFPMHVHDAVEMICVAKGSVRLTIAGEAVCLGPGDMAIAFPAVPHSYDQVSADADGMAMIFVPGVIQEFHNTFRTMMPRSAKVSMKQQDPELGRLLHSAMHCPPEKFRQLRLGHLHLMLGYLLPCMQLVPVNKHLEMGLSHQVFHYISQHFTEPLSLESVAHALGISRIHLSHIFSQQLKINFRQYINTLRIDRACALLQDPANTISQIAYLCGYGNPRTFHRAFLSQCHMPPKQYRARLNIHNAADDEQEDGAEEA